MFLISVFVCFCIASVINYFKTSKQRSFIKNLKGPFTFPLMGSLHKLIFMTPKNFQLKSRKYLETFGSFSRCWIFHRLFIPITDYEVVEQLLNSDVHLNTGYALLKPWLGGSLLTIDGDKWAQRRQFLSHHAFQVNMLNEFVKVFNDHSKVLVEQLRVVSDGHTTFDINTFISKAVLEIMIDSTLGTNERCQKRPCTDYAKNIADLTAQLTDRFLRLSSANNVTFTIMCPRQKRRQKRLIKAINSFNNEIIKEKRIKRDLLLKKDVTDLNDSIYTIEMTDGEGAQPHISLLDILLAAHIENVSLNDQEICAELNSFLFQGFLLTTAALNFTLINLARHPRVQTKVFNEMKEICGNTASSGSLNVNLLNRLQYMECVIKETLRLYPSLPIIGRELSKPFEYSHSKVGNGILPVGAEIYIYLFEMLRNETKFKHAEHFYPERFAIEDNNHKNLLYFSLGPRDCIAQKFAILLMKVVLVNILEEFELLPFGDQIQLQFQMVLKSTNGFQIGLQPR